MTNFADVLETIRRGRTGGETASGAAARASLSERMALEQYYSTRSSYRNSGLVGPVQTSNGSLLAVGVDTAAPAWEPVNWGPSAIETLGRAFPGSPISEVYWYLDPATPLATPQAVPQATVSSYIWKNPEDSGSGMVVDAPERSMVKREAVDAPNLDLTDPRQKLAMEAETLLGYDRLREEVGGAALLARALAKLEIEILDKRSVFAYKQQMVEHFRTARKLADPTWRLTRLSEYKQPVPEFVLRKAVDIKRELPGAEFYIEQLKEDPFLIVTLGPLEDWNIGIRTLDRPLSEETAAYIEVWAEPKFEGTL